MADQKKRISELPTCTDVDGLVTIGVDGNNESVKVPIGYIVTACAEAAEGAIEAKGECETATADAAQAALTANDKMAEYDERMLNWADAEHLRKDSEEKRVTAETERAAAETARAAASAKAVSECETATAGAGKVNAEYADGRLTVTDRNGTTKTADLAEAATVGERLAAVEEKVAQASESYCEVTCATDSTMTVDGKAVSVKGGVKTKLYPTWSFSASSTSIVRFDGTHLDTSEFTSFAFMFTYCTKLSSFVGYENWNTSKVTRVDQMFAYGPAMGELDLSGWDMSNCSIKYPFYSSSTFYLRSLNIAGWDVRKEDYFPALNLPRLEYLNVSGVNMTGVKYMHGTFASPLLKYIAGISDLDTSSVVSIRLIFYHAYSLVELDLSGWDMSSCTDFNGMFQYGGGESLTSFKLGEGFGKMPDEAKSVDFSGLGAWTQNTDTLLNLYDRAANGMGNITIRLSAATQKAFGASNIEKLTAKGYTITN